MLEWLQNHVLETLYAAMIALLGGAYHVLRRKVAAQKQQYDHTYEGVKALLHDRIYMECSRWIEAGYCSLEDRKNIEYMYRPYHSLGGNGTGERLYNVMQSLPFEPQEKETSHGG